MRGEFYLHVDAVYTPALTVVTEGVLTINANSFLVRILNLLSIIRLGAIRIDLAWICAEWDSIVVT